MLESLSPIDGRYQKRTFSLAAYFSEKALMKYRLTIEGEYLIALSEEKAVHLRKFTEREKKLIRQFYDLDLVGANKIKEFEAVTNHDVKAVEYFLKEKLKKTSLKDSLEWIHFALTSEDINNLAYALMLSESLKDIIIPALDKIVSSLNAFAQEYQGLSMLARTHGQSASPTTLGKEFKVFSSRLTRQLDTLKKQAILVKLNGATGNYNAQVVAYPKIDWPKFTVSFVERLNKERRVNLEPNLITTQIEPHDTYSELFDLMRRINTILIDCNQDIWRYVSDRWIITKVKETEIGSSTMPHKVNPINFENSEGNLGLANALFLHFSSKLPISRLQRDLSDSTVERNFGVAFAHSLVGYNSLVQGLGKISADQIKIAEDLANHPEIMAEGIQTILRREGVSFPYEKLKALTRGKKVSREDLDRFIDGLSVSEKIKQELRKITPQNYTGLAEKLVDL